MFLLRRPSPAAIERFLRESQDAALSYGPIGLVRQVPVDRPFDEQVVAIGHGADDFRSGPGRADGVEAVRSRMGRPLSAAGTDRRRNRRRRRHPSSRLLVDERMPRPVPRRWQRTPTAASASPTAR